jgi:hypothetical protein
MELAARKSGWLLSFRWKGVHLLILNVPTIHRKPTGRNPSPSAAPPNDTRTHLWYSGECCWYGEGGDCCRWAGGMLDMGSCIMPPPWSPACPVPIILPGVL